MKGPFAFYLEIVEARNSATPGGGPVSNPFASISLIHDPNSMEKQDLFRIDHVTSSGVDVRFLQLLPHASPGLLARPSPFWSTTPHAPLYAVNLSHHVLPPYRA